MLHENTVQFWSTTFILKIKSCFSEFFWGWKRFQIDVSASLTGLLQKIKKKKVNMADCCFCFVTALWDISRQFREMSNAMVKCAGKYTSGTLHECNISLLMNGKNLNFNLKRIPKKQLLSFKGEKKKFQKYN